MLAARHRRPDPRRRRHPAVRRRAGSSTCERRSVLGEHGRRRAGAADHGPRPERRRVVAHGPALSPRLRVITFDHRGIGRSRVADATATRPRRWPTTPSSVLDELGLDSRARLRLLARRHGRAAAGAPAPGPGPVARARRDPAGGRARRARRMPRSWRSSGGARRWSKEEAAWASVEFNYGPRCRARARRSHRRGHRAAARAAVQRAGLPRAAVRGGDAQLLRAADRIQAPTFVVHGAPRPRHPGRERAI